MLTYLRARNLGVLEDASIEPGPGFTVITGETGAGKTMLLGALRLLTGEKAKPSSVGPFGDETVSEGLFSVGDDELGITRVVPRSGKSRAYLDGSLVAATALAHRLGDLVEIVGQHDQMLLKSSQSVLQLVDGALDGKGQKVREGYDVTWARHRAALDRQRQLGGDRMGLERELDLVRYQVREIESASLEPGDDRRMESMLSRLRSAELIRDNLGLAREELESIADSAGSVVSRLRKVAAVDDTVHDRLAQAEAIGEMTQDLLRQVREAAETTSEDPDALEQVEQRLTALGDLKRKYGKTLDDVLEFGTDAARRASELESLLEEASAIEDLVVATGKDVIETGSELTAARGSAIARIEEDAKEHLAVLGLPSVALRFVVEATEPGSSGADRIELLFASDDRLEAGAVQDVASGGELSRLVLALRLATRSQDTTTLVFDEVDAGVGGATALALGRKLAELAQSCQVLCVTHLPQVAAFADAHYVIDRAGTSAMVRLVEGEERLTELSRMLAGLPESERGREAAAELLEGAHV
jgi:DNA repair protein RecN (Recombination protein N)